MDNSLREFSTAQKIVLENIKPVPDETINLEESVERITAESICCQHPVPAFNNSKMDGFAVRLEDAVKGQKKFLKISGESAAGPGLPPELPAGTALRIMTGAAVPDVADCVIKIENCEVDNDRVKFSQQEIHSGLNIRRMGSDMEAGEVAVAAGHRGSPASLGAIMLTGQSQLKVHQQPRVLLISTGDELVRKAGKKLKPGEIYDVSSHSLPAFVEAAGGRVVDQLQLPDDPRKSLKRLKRLQVDWDIAVSTGGVSMGEYDYTLEIFEQLGGQLEFHGVRQKPGKPLAFGKLNEKAVLMLPGNVVSSLVNSLLYLGPAIKKAAGSREFRPEFIQLNCQEEFPKTGQRLTFFRGKTVVEEGIISVKPSSNQQGSHILSSLTTADCLVKVDAGKQLKRGDRAEVMFFNHQL